jgi:uncharacterized protein (DUF433 family)
MTLPDFLTPAPDGEIRLAGHRIGLYHLVERYNEGDSAEMIANRYPTLPLALVHRTIAFYLDNRVEVDAYVAACASALGQQRAAAPPLDLNALRDRLSAVPNSAAPAGFSIY